jgi:hypothetical protein
MRGELDCHTERGARWITKQCEIASRVASRFGYGVVHTPDGDAKLDCLFIKDGNLVGVAEIKSRDLLLRQLEGHGSYLITEEKLLIGIEVAKALRVPFCLIINLTDADVIIRICNSKGEKCVHWESKVTTTQATCNGGEAVRQNAYVSLEGMNVFRRF